MALNFLISPFGSPLKIVELDMVPDVRYHTIHSNQDWFSESLKAYQQKRLSNGDKVDYNQKWQRTDRIKDQIGVPAGRNIIARLIDCKNLTITTIGGAQSVVIPGDVYTGTQVERFQYNFTLASLNVPNDKYWVVYGVSNEELNVDNNYTYKYYISEPLEFRDSWPHTLYVEYANKRNDYNLRFDLVSKFGIRVEGVIDEPTATYEDSDFEDQQQNGVKLYSGLKYEYEVTFGAKSKRAGAPLPQWIINKVAEAMRCNALYIDGKPFFRPNNAALDITPLGANSVLKNASITLNGYEEEYNSVHGSSRIIFDFPAFPFAIRNLFLYDGQTTVPLFTNRVLNNAAGLDALVSDANNLGYDGLFSRSGNTLIYDKGRYERFIDITGNVRANVFSFSLANNNTSGNNNFIFDYAGTYVVIEWETGVVETITTTNPNTVRSVTHTYLNSANKVARVFHDNSIGVLRAVNDTVGFRVTNFTGTVPRGINDLQFYRQNMAAFDAANIISPLNVKAPALTNIAISTSNLQLLTSITTNGANVLRNYNFQANQLDVTNVNRVLNDLYASDFGVGGTLLIRQNPPAAPTGTALTVAKPALINSGWTVLTD